MLEELSDSEWEDILGQKLVCGGVAASGNGENALPWHNDRNMTNANIGMS